MKTWVNGELLDATKMNTLEQSIPASATSANGVVTFKNGNGTDLFTVAVQGSSYVKLAEDDYTVSTSSTTSALVGYLNATSAAWTSAKMIYVSVRDKAGKRQGYYYGGDFWFANTYPVNGSTSKFGTRCGLAYCYDSNGEWKVSNTNSDGLYAYDIATNGDVRLYSRYNSSTTMTMDGTYHVEVYALSWADSSPLT